MCIQLSQELRNFEFAFSDWKIEQMVSKALVFWGSLPHRLHGFLDLLGLNSCMAACHTPTWWFKYYFPWLVRSAFHCSINTEQTEMEPGAKFKAHEKHFQGWQDQAGSICILLSLAILHNYNISGNKMKLLNSINKPRESCW